MGNSVIALLTRLKTGVTTLQLASGSAARTLPPGAFVANLSRVNNSITAVRFDATWTTFSSDFGGNVSFVALLPSVDDRVTAARETAIRAASIWCAGVESLTEITFFVKRGK